MIFYFIMGLVLALNGLGSASASKLKKRS